MAFPTTSFVPYSTIRDALKNTIALNIAGSSPDTFKVALYGDTATVSDADDPISYTATGEVTGTNWSAGGVSLTGVTNAIVASTGIMIDDTGNVSVANTTLSTAIKGCIVYDDTISPKAAIAVVYFGSATGYTTNDGTFGITWDANGIWRITLHN